MYLTPRYSPLFAVLLAAILLPLAAHAQSQDSTASFGAAGPVDITSKQLDVQQAKGLATFTGDVVVKQAGFNLAAPVVTATYGANGPKGSSSDVKDITASGGVTILHDGAGGVPEKAVGTTAVYTPGIQQVVLTGDVTLTRGPSQLSGDKLVYDLASGNARVTNSKGPVKARFVPGK